MQPDTDVIIVGAGAAGLSAAKELARRGHTCKVIEGSHRIGGRAYSEEIATGVWFDLGCAWLVGGAANPFTAIADKLGIALSKEKSDLFVLESLRFWQNGRPLDDKQRLACLRYYDDSYAAIASAANQSLDVAISDVVDIENKYAPPLLSGIASAWGMDADLVSTTDLASATGDLGFQAPHGYGNLVAAWGADVDVSLNTRAERVDWSGGGVIVATPKGTITGRVALITVSTGILASADIRFHPNLPVWKTEAICDLPMGTENKIGVHSIRMYSVPKVLDSSVPGTTTEVRRRLTQALWDSIRPRCLSADDMASGWRSRANARVKTSQSTELPISSETAFASTWTAASQRRGTPSPGPWDRGHAPNLGRLINAPAWRAPSTGACSLPGRPRSTVGRVPATGLTSLASGQRMRSRSNWRCRLSPTVLPSQTQPL